MKFNNVKQARVLRALYESGACDWSQVVASGVMSNYHLTYEQVRGKKIGRGGFEMHKTIGSVATKMQKLFNARAVEAKAFDREGNTVARVWVMDDGKWNWFCEQEEA